MMPESTVFVVDDDEALRESLERLMESIGLPVETYSSAQSYLETFDPTRPGCLVLDIRMPGMSGLELQEKLAADHVNIPIIIMSGHGDVEKAVQAMRRGAVDFIRKPYKGRILLDRIRQALEKDAGQRRQEADRADVTARIATLTPREREVMELLVVGDPPKRIAFQLGLSRKTVDAHRAHIMIKMRVRSTVELLRLVQAYDVILRGSPA